MSKCLWSTKTYLNREESKKWDELKSFSLLITTTQSIVDPAAARRRGGAASTRCAVASACRRLKERCSFRLYSVSQAEGGRWPGGRGVRRGAEGRSLSLLINLQSRHVFPPAGPLPALSHVLVQLSQIKTLTYNNYCHYNFAILQLIPNVKNYQEPEVHYVIYNNSK